MADKEDKDKKEKEVKAEDKKKSVAKKPAAKKTAKKEEKPKAKAKEEKKPAAKKTAKKTEEKTKAKVEKKPAKKAEEPIKDLKDIGEAVETDKTAEAAQPETVAGDDSQAQKADDPRKPKLDEKGRAYGTGRRKDAVARVWIQKGSGKVIVNGKDQAVYFGRNTHRLILNQPFLIVNNVGNFDVMCTVKGGGLSGQAGAVRHGISRALENFDPSMRPALKKAGMMTRDARIVERKKVGKHKARRTKQWAKR